MFTNTAAKDNSVFLWLISCCAHKPLLMPVICWWAPGLFPRPGSCKQCCYEHWGACTFFELEFLFFQDICSGVELLGHMVTLEFFKVLHTVVHNGSTNLHSNRWWTRVPCFPHHLQHFLSVDFLTTAILTGVRCHLIAVLTCILLITREVKLEKAMALHSSTLAWKSHGWRSLVGCSPWGR